MPPLGSNLVDQQGVQLLIDWIQGELPARQSYAEWRAARFGPAPTPDGEPGFDADGDGRANHDEFLALTDPLAADLAPVVVLENDGEVRIAAPAPPGRSLLFESSPDLLDWSPWPATGNDGIARPPGSLLELAAPPAGPRHFFRARLREE
jgi:hypothetical protein